MNASEHLDKAKALLTQGKEQDALDELEAALNFEPDNAEILLWRGDVFRTMNRFGAARKDYERAVELGAVGYDVWLPLGICQHKVGSFVEAEETFNKALDARDKSADALYWRGRNYFELRSYNNAIADLGQAVELDTNNQGAKAFLSLSYSHSTPVVPPPPTDWNNFPKSSYYRKAHKDAKAILKESLFWSLDDYSPIGGDDGSDCLDDLWKWRKKHPNQPMRDFLDWLFGKWGYDRVEILRIANGDSSHCVGDIHSVANVYDDIVIATSFGQFMFDGYLDDELRTLVMTAIERQMQPEVLEFRGGDKDYAIARRKIKEGLLSMPGPIQTG